MRVAVPHNLGREEARRRLKERGHEMADKVGGSFAKVTTGWPNDDQMTITVEALGQAMGGLVDIEDTQVVFEVDLPGALSFVEPMMAGAIRQSGQKLLGPPKT
jgi:hypothetical protein